MGQNTNQIQYVSITSYRNWANPIRYQVHNIGWSHSSKKSPKLYFIVGIDLVSVDSNRNPEKKITKNEEDDDRLKDLFMYKEMLLSRRLKLFKSYIYISKSYFGDLRVNSYVFGYYGCIDRFSLF